MRVLLADMAVPAIIPNTTGLGFSGSGFLAVWFVGVLSTFETKGLLGNSGLKYAGVSGGALTTTAMCAGLSVAQLRDNTLNLARACRGNNGCSGTLNTRVKDALWSNLPSDAYTKCSGRETIAISEVAVPGPDRALWVTSYSSNSDLVEAAAASAFIPLHSGPPGVTTTQFCGKTVYDGGFTTALPCPQGVSHCIRVSAEPYGTAAGADAAIRGLLSAATVITTGAGQVVGGLVGAANGIFNGVFGTSLPTQPLSVNGAVAIMPPPPSDLGTGGDIDIAPGKYEPLRFSPEQWGSFSINPPDDATLQYMYDLGARDAEHWWKEHGASFASQPPAAG